MQYRMSSGRGEESSSMFRLKEITTSRPHDKPVVTAVAVVGNRKYNKG